MTRREMYIILTRLMEKAGYLDQMKVIPTENLKSPITREEVVRWIQILAISKGSIYY